ncbi:MAG: alkaline phosphatase family protein [Gammaproteobacteria bacterium]|nr:alkaline phosphatase family protein [Gammaproteobacteria bacterium]MDX2461433.1 alkaline phosphatase family protein [Gammaproteobacteria bacterium]
MNNQFLLVGFDGLRPEMVTEELMPNLYRHAAEGVTFKNHRCVFPSETYVNLLSLVTGSVPSRHGLVANHYLDAKVDPRERFEGSSVERIEKAQRAYGGKLFDALSLGEILGQAGRRMAVISTNTPGSTRLKHHQVLDHAHLSLSCHTPDASHPRHEVEAIVERLGTPSQKVFPDVEGLSYATDVFLEHVCGGELPDLTILWYGEPDNSYHVFGIGETESLDALRHADAEFGRILNWWRSSDKHDSLQIIAISDHAHITQKTQVNMQDLLRDAGFNVDDNLADGADLALVPGYSGRIWLRDNDAGRTQVVAQALMEMDCCGMVFTAGRDDIEGIVPGSFSRSLVMADHPRSPDIYYILRTDDENDSNGFMGTCYFDTGLPVGGGIHGGLHHKELNPLCAATGSLFGEGVAVETHSGIVDIAPTILHGLGISPPATMEGRVLHEAFADNRGTPEASVAETFETGTGHYEQVLRRSRVGDACYLDGGSRSS